MLVNLGLKGQQEKKCRNSRNENEKINVWSYNKGLLDRIQNDSI